MLLGMAQISCSIGMLFTASKYFCVNSTQRLSNIVELCFYLYYTITVWGNILDCNLVFSTFYFLLRGYNTND